MIQPNHFCDYSRRRETTVRFRYGIFHADGTSLPVVFDAFHNAPLRWYTHPYGHRYRVFHENLRLVAVGQSDPVPPDAAYEGLVEAFAAQNLQRVSLPRREEDMRRWGAGRCVGRYGRPVCEVDAGLTRAAGRQEGAAEDGARWGVSGEKEKRVQQGNLCRYFPRDI